MNLRIGHGYDAHRFVEGGTLVIGGVTIPHSHSLLAHSDGDVLIHALCDALLGAAGLGDIGRHFPDTEDEYENVDSRKLLRHVRELLWHKSLYIGNADITLIAQVPRMAPHVDAMCDCLAEDLDIDRSLINIKATTTEGMGFTGRKEGIEVHAVVLLQEVSR